MFYSCRSVVFFFFLFFFFVVVGFVVVFLKVVGNDDVFVCDISFVYTLLSFVHNYVL